MAAPARTTPVREDANPSAGGRVAGAAGAAGRKPVEHVDFHAAPQTKAVKSAPEDRFGTPKLGKMKRSSMTLEDGAADRRVNAKRAKRV
jgi:hypothetical protein